MSIKLLLIPFIYVISTYESYFLIIFLIIIIDNKIATLSFTAVYSCKSRYKTYQNPRYNKFSKKVYFKY